MAAGTDSGGGGSNIRVTVRWAEPNVFAGEEVRCRITFRNVAKPAPPAPPSVENSNDAASSSSSSSALRQQHARPRQASPLSNSVTPAGLAPPSASRPGAGAAAQHRSTMSLNVPAGAATARQRSGTTTGTATPPGTGTGTWAGGGEASGAGGSSGSSSPQQQPPPTPTQGGRPHRRSISIVSMASSSGTAEEAGHQQASPAQSNGGGASRGRAAGHSRSSSFHITPRGLAAVPNGPASGMCLRPGVSSRLKSTVFGTFSANSWPFSFSQRRSRTGRSNCRRRRRCAPTVRPRQRGRTACRRPSRRRASSPASASRSTRAPWRRAARRRSMSRRT